MSRYRISFWENLCKDAPRGEKLFPKICSFYLTLFGLDQYPALFCVLSWVSLRSSLANQCFTTKPISQELNHFSSHIYLSRDQGFVTEIIDRRVKDLILVLYLFLARYMLSTEKVPQSEIFTNDSKQITQIWKTLLSLTSQEGLIQGSSQPALPQNVNVVLPAVSIKMKYTFYKNLI